jgi:zinc protease
VGRWLDGHAALLDGFFGRSSLGIALESTSDCFSELFELAMDCCSDPQFREDELERQRRNTLEELQAQANDPGVLALRGALAGLYGKHPSARPLRGDPKVVRRTRAEDLSKLVAAQGWRDAVISIAGDVDPERIARRIEARLLTQVPGRADAPSLRERIGGLGAPPARRKRPKRSELSWPQAAQSQVVIAYPGIAQSDPRRLAMDLMCEYLGAQTGPLFNSLREERGLVYHVGAAATAGLDVGHVLLHAAASPVNFDDALLAIDEVVERFVEQGPDPDGLEQARATLAGYFSSMWQRRARIASLLARAELRGAPAAGAYQLVDALRRVSLDEVVELARFTFDPRARVVSIVRGG